jgi:hypothetical protein
MDEEQGVPKMMNYPVFMRIDGETCGLIEMGVFVVKAGGFGKADHYMGENVGK